MSSPTTSPVRFTVRPDAIETLRNGRFLSSSAVYGWMAFAIFLFLLQALPYLSHRWVTDESWYAGPAYSIAHGNGLANPAFGPNELENQCDSRSPGTALVMGAAFRIFGTSQIPARLGSILAGFIIIILTYFLARDVIGEKGALVATFLVATDNLIVLTSRSARPEALTSMAVMAALLAIKQYAWKGRIGWAFLGGLFVAMGSMFHVELLGCIISIGILVIFIDHRRGGFPLRGAFIYSLGYAVGLVPFATWILTNPLGLASFRQEFLNRAMASSTLWSRLLGEGRRYSDLLGLNMLHGHGLESIPVRLPIPLFILAATFLLWKLRRQWFYLEILLITPTVLWFIYMSTYKLSRYLVLLSPFFALAIGAAVAATREYRSLHRIVLIASCLVVAAQMSANFLLLHAARNADYNKVAAELRNVIPSGQTAYGSVTFWMALHDHPFISYERTTPWMAARQFHARYFITGDRIMTSPGPGEEAFNQSLNRSMAEVIDQSRLVGHFPDPYYGDLKIYELNAP
jgi:4-amino-4-deoxy-L-arabinose transferase-like glycosyltransferase